MNNFDVSPQNFDPHARTAYEITDVSRECEPPYLMLAAGLVGQQDLETAINVAYFARMSVGRALVMHGVVQQSSLDLAIDLSLLLRNKRIKRSKAIEMLRFEGEVIKLQIGRDSVMKNVSSKVEAPLPESTGDHVAGLPVAVPFPWACPEKMPVIDFVPTLASLPNPMIKALQGAYSKNSVFYSSS